eukprot:6713206-Heterocapsa_arctica.AAC.1
MPLLSPINRALTLVHGRSLSLALLTIRPILKFDFVPVLKILPHPGNRLASDPSPEDPPGTFN